MILQNRKKKGWPPCSVKRYDEPILPCLCLIMHVISSVQVKFCSNLDRQKALETM